MEAAKDKVYVIGSGITGCVLARELAEMGKEVVVYERRNHIAGNAYDYLDDYGIRVHKYGPHIFHTNSKDVYDYVSKYARWEEYKLVCGAEIDGKCVPTAFNHTAIDTFFGDKAEEIKREIEKEYPEQRNVAVVDMLQSNNTVVREYAEFLYEKDYKPYTAKQWGISPDEIDVSVLKRVPIKIGYENAYFEDVFQMMPCDGYVEFCNNLLNHEHIQVNLNEDVKERLKIRDHKMFFDDVELKGDVFFTGAIDELFEYKFGRLLYRTLKFQWKHEEIESFQNMPVVAYPQAEGYTRITEYKKLPYQQVSGTTYAIEYPVAYSEEVEEMERYYPVLTEKSQSIFLKYWEECQKIEGLYCCGRLADFKYYNMDQAIMRALAVVKGYEGKENEKG